MLVFQPLHYFKPDGVRAYTFFEQTFSNWQYAWKCVLFFFQPYSFNTIYFKRYSSISNTIGPTIRAEIVPAYVQNFS